MTKTFSIEDMVYEVDMNEASESTGGCAICSIYYALVYVDSVVLDSLELYAMSVEWYAHMQDGYYLLSIDKQGMKSVTYLENSEMIEDAHSLVMSSECFCV